MDDSTTLYEGKYLHLIRRGHWEYAHRPGITGIVGICAVTDDRKLILVEQYRAPTNKRVIELPAGLSGDVDTARGESLVEAAKRELLEETGYAARDMKQIAHGPMSSGISDEIITLFLATGLTKQSDGGGDESEDIVVHLVPVDQVDAWLAEQERAGKLVDVKIFTGLRFVK